MSVTTILVALFGAVKACLPVILAVASGLGMILTKGMSWGISEVFQGLTMVFSGVSLVGIKNAVVSEVSALLKDFHTAPAPASGTSTTGGTSTDPANKAS